MPGLVNFFDKNIFLLYNSTMSQIDHRSNITNPNLLPSPGEFFILISNFIILIISKSLKNYYKALKRNICLKEGVILI